MTDHDDFSLPSTVGTSVASGANGPVIKILLGGQVRRVPAHRLVKTKDGSNNKPSYRILRALVARYAFPDRKAPGRDCEVTTTYVDEDGDAITISTDDELEDALVAVVAEAGDGKKQVLRIDAAVKEIASASENRKTANDDEEKQKPKAMAAPAAETEAKKLQLPERKLACGQVGKLQWDLLAVGEGELDAESKDAADRLVKDIVGSIALKNEHAPNEGEAETKEKGGDNKKNDDVPKAQAEASVFIHARHTCDGCGVSPIMGVRYHATDRTDYDICQPCFADPSVGCSDQKNFVTEELDRDRVMQHRWARRFAHGQRMRCGHSAMRCHQGSLREHHRQARRGRHCPMAPAQQAFGDSIKKVVDQKQDDIGKQLQEAVLLSMQKDKAAIAKEVKGGKKTEEKTDTNKAEDETASQTTASTEKEEATKWRSVADSFSSVAAGNGNFADVLDAVALVMATEIEKQADVAADATRSAGGAAADSTRSAGTTSVPNGIAAAVTAAMKASRVASTVASEVKAVIDKEFQKQHPEEGFSATGTNPGEVSPSVNEEVEDVPDIEGDNAKTDDVSVCSKEGEGKDGDEAEASAPVESAEGEIKDEGEDKLIEDNESEKSDWEDVGTVDDKVEVASDGGSASPPAAIAPPVLACWAEQLTVLRQLGFMDDHKSVDALETLQAANMGVDSTDKVTVGDAVNYLLKNAGD